MRKRVLFGAAAACTLAAAVLPGVAGGAAPPPYALSCVNGGITTVAWKHAKLVQVTIDWSASPGSGVTFDPQVDPVLVQTPPRGSIITNTPTSGGVEPVSVAATFEGTDGSTNQTSVTCT
jgi:hypothetical protein